MDLSLYTPTNASLSLIGDGVELGDSLTATVHVHSNSTASTNTTIIVIRKSLVFTFNLVTVGVKLSRELCSMHDNHVNTYS